MVRENKTKNALQKKEKANAFLGKLIAVQKSSPGGGGNTPLPKGPDEGAPWKCGDGKMPVVAFKPGPPKKKKKRKKRKEKKTAGNNQHDSKF